MGSTDLEAISLEAAAAGFSALGDPVRLRILAELIGGQRCVCELLEEIAIAPNLLSYHLRVLRQAGLVEGSRRGRWVDYRLAVGALEELRAAVPAAGAV
ncbi:MAG: transcriptional regulator [Actinobacteria bacterium RBG_16_67_15]|nr:MAG: transcriptional regulator [Actinobacteria bacterium RBG_16_67_15]